MSLDKPQSRQQRVQNVVGDFLDSDEYGNSYRYFRAADIADSDPELSAAMVGSYLPKLEDESPLSSGIAVARHTDSRNSATLWIVRREEG